MDFTAQNNALLTLGIQPTRPDTGYGYINYDQASQDGIHKLIQFTEKPVFEKAKAFLESGDYLWNAGIFIWKVESILAAFQQYEAPTYELLAAGNGVYNTVEEQAFIDEAYPKTTNISIDFAIMEKADNVYTIPSSFGWSDLGTWASLHSESAKDENGNVINGERVISFETTNSLIRAPKDKLVIIKGLDDYIIVDESDVLLIYPKSKEQEIKAVTGVVKEQLGPTYL